MDRYTKFIMTLIAMSLMWISLLIKPPFSIAYAGIADTRIEIVDISVARHRALPVIISGEIICKTDR